MKRLILIAVTLILGSGCATGAYKPQTTLIKKTATMPEYTLKVYASKIEMQNAYAVYTVNRVGGYGGRPLVNREKVAGFFSHSDDTIHCVAPFPQETIDHEKLHLKVKYGLSDTRHPHFVSKIKRRKG